jgi:hypothetical protein
MITFFKSYSYVYRREFNLTMDYLSKLTGRILDYTTINCGVYPLCTDA